MAIEPKQTQGIFDGFRDLHQEIFKKISILEHGGTLRLVCQLWKKFSEDDLLWAPVATTLKMKLHDNISVYHQVKTLTQLKITELKEAESIVDIKEWTAIEFDFMMFSCQSDKQMTVAERNKKLNDIQHNVEDKLVRFDKIEKGFYAILFLSRIGKSMLERACYYANQLIIKGGSSQYFVNLVDEALDLGLIDQAKILVTKIVTPYELNLARLAFIRMYCQSGRLDKAIQEIKAIEINARRSAISMISTFIPKENYSLREEVTLLEQMPYLNLSFLIQDLIEAGKMLEAKCVWYRNIAILNNPPVDLQKFRLKMDVWFGRAAEAFERIKKLNLKERDNTILLYVLRNELMHRKINPELLVEVNKMIGALPQNNEESEK